MQYHCSAATISYVHMNYWTASQVCPHPGKPNLQNEIRRDQFCCTSMHRHAWSGMRWIVCWNVSHLHGNLATAVLTTASQVYGIYIYWKQQHVCLPITDLCDSKSIPVAGLPVSCGPTWHQKKEGSDNRFLGTRRIPSWAQVQWERT